MSKRDVATTGIPGLDEVLCGGFPRARLYLIEGDPGVGKTTLALQFLMAGRDAGERCLYITLSETEAEILAVAHAHGWSLDNIALLELSALEQQLRIDAETTMFHPSEVQLAAFTQKLLERIEELRPTRVAFDSLSELRLLAQSPLRYRREVLSFKQYFVGKQCTVLLLDDRTAESGDIQVQSVAHGVIALEQHAPVIGAVRRRLRVQKLRGTNFRSGYHDFNVITGGLEVYPRLIAADHTEPFAAEAVSSGVPALDVLIGGGGLHRGTSTLVLGPAGAGKSSIAARYAVAAAERGERATIFTFDEIAQTLLARCDALGFDLTKHVKAGTVVLRQIDPAEMGPGEFLAHAQRAVERDGAKTIVIDSINGLLQSMPEDDYIYMQLHELLSYFSQRGVTTLMTMAQLGMLGANVAAPVDISYITDGVLLLRFFEANGRVHRAISMVKKRSGRHEDTIRELGFGPSGVIIGEPLVEFHGVLTGVPTFTGSREKLGDS